MAVAPDAELTALSVEGDELAAREIVRRFERPVLNLIARLIQDRAAAEDLAQEAFLKVFRSLDTYDPRWRLSAWVLKIAHNTAIDYLRRRRPHLVPLDVPAGDEGLSLAERMPDARAEAPDATLQRSTLLAAVDAALDRLRPEYRQVLVLRFQEDLDYEEIAGVLDLPVGTVKTFIHRGRRALAAALAEAGWSRGETGHGPGS